MLIAFRDVLHAPHRLELIDAKPTMPWVNPSQVAARVYRPGELPLVRDREIWERHDRLLGVYVQLDRQFDRFERVWSDGQIVNSKVMDEMKSGLQRHPKPSDAVMLSMLAAHGAKYPPSAREAFSSDGTCRRSRRCSGPSTRSI